MAGRKTTIADVAQRAGVSKGLVSFALNGRPGVSPETRERILSVAHDMGWQPDARARALSTNRSLAYGLVLSRNPSVLSSDPFFPTFISGVERAISGPGHVLVLSVVESLERELETYRSLLESGRVDGVFLTDVRRDDPRLALVQELSAHAVVLGHPRVDAGFPTLSVSDEAALDALVAHLVALGHHELGLVVGPSHMLHAERWRDSLVAAATTRGLRTPRIVETDFSAEMGLAATRELLEGRTPPTAIVYANDHMALAGLGHARRAGIEVPRELSIVGYGDSDMTRYAYPSLTTVSVDVAEWGYRAAQLLMSQVEGGTDDVGQPPPARLEVRESTASVPERPVGP
ncbi:LacI family DNA-binding transcriptional regulator [Jiangella anatolica]|uniref:LacI family transcriptional regulator n=1 Tax=Jiangella anatolica TaxID=2670374 RepID=A0A2W2CPQ8_9ACTN|nr:LacI family DNA-binding transcriptional regulator [Jiangella anatolica]PZF82203.1 LacI family transcriptional regulator [Jiangella anatolica]